MLADRIRQLLHDRHPEEGGHRWLADKLGIERSAVTQWITGANRPSDLNLMRLGRVFELSDEEVMDLIRMKHPEPPSTTEVA